MSHERRPWFYMTDRNSEKYRPAVIGSFLDNWTTRALDFPCFQPISRQQRQRILSVLIRHDTKNCQQMLPRLIVLPKTAHILIKMEINWGTASKFSQPSGYANEIENEAGGSPSGKSRSGRDVPRWRATSAVRCHTRLTKHSVPSLTEVVTLTVRCSFVLMVG